MEMVAGREKEGKEKEEGREERFEGGDGKCGGDEKK